MQENKKAQRDCQRKPLIIETGKYKSLSEDCFEIQRTVVYIAWWNMWDKLKNSGYKYILNVYNYITVSLQCQILCNTYYIYNILLGKLELKLFVKKSLHELYLKWRVTI